MPYVDHEEMRRQMNPPPGVDLRPGKKPLRMPVIRILTEDGPQTAVSATVVSELEKRLMNTLKVIAALPEATTLDAAETAAMLDKAIRLAADTLAAEERHVHFVG